MSTPRTDAACFSATTEKPESGDFELCVVDVSFANALEREIADWKARYDSLNHIRCNLDIKLTVALADAAALRKELAEVTAAFQKECDHEFETEDHSFSHEFGTEKIFVCRCTKCGKDAEPGDLPDPEPPERDDDEPNYDAERPLTPLENHQRNDEHSPLL